MNLPQNVYREPYCSLLRKFLLVRNAPYRSDPERQEAMMAVIEQTLIEMLQALEIT